MAAIVHSDKEENQVEVDESSEDGYWPALEILSEKKHDYLVNWDGINPETGRAWTPSWTRKTEVTDDLIEAWEIKKAAKKKNNHRAPKTPKRSPSFPAPTARKPANKSSRSSRNSQMSSGQPINSPVISPTSNNSSRVAVIEEPSFRKRKRRSIKYAPVDEDTTPVSKKQRVDGKSSASQKSTTKSIKNYKRIGEETIPEEEEEEGPIETGNMAPSPSTPKAGISGGVVRIGPPRKRKKVTPSSSRVPGSEFRKSREDENTHEPAGSTSSLSLNPATAKKKRRLKPAPDVRPKLSVLVKEEHIVSPSHNATHEFTEPRYQGPSEADPPPSDHDNEPSGPLPEFIPPRTTHKQPPLGPPIDGDSSIPTPRTMNNAKKIAPIPRLEPSHFKPYLKKADTTSAIDEFSPNNPFPTQETIESSVQDSQALRTVSQPHNESSGPAPFDGLFDDDIAQKMQDAEDAYLNLDGQANGIETPNELTTDPDSAEQEPPRSHSPAGRANAPVPMQSSNSQKLEDALVLLNQKSEEIEVFESRLAAQEAQIEHLQVENYGIQVEYEKLSVAQEVQREVLEDAKGNVSELGVHIDWVQGLLDKSEAKVKQLQGEIDEIRGALGVKVEEHNLARIEWEHERAALEAKLASSGEVISQQPPAGWELENKELKDKLAESTTERDRLEKDKRYAENEVETWKEQYRKGFIHSQELREEAKDAKAEASRVRGENAILTAQTREAVRLVTAKYEGVVEKLKKELAKAESLYKILQAKDEQTGDDLRGRAASATLLQEEVHRLHEKLASELAEKAARAARLKHGGYACQILVNEARCDQGFDSPQELWTHVVDGHVPLRGHQ